MYNYTVSCNFFIASTKKKDIFNIKKGKRMCKKKVIGCEVSEFGCCFDGKTPAKGPFSAGKIRSYVFFSIFS